MIDKRTSRVCAVGLAVALCGAIGVTGYGLAPPGEEAGNNLSYPVIWSDGVAKSLPGLPGMEPVLTGAWWYWWGTEGVDPDVYPLSCPPDPDDPSLCDDGIPGMATGDPPGVGYEDALVKAYLQKDQGNVWQAGSWPEGGVRPDMEVYVDLIDWGDNLESVNWYTNSMVRVETVLYEDAYWPPDFPNLGAEPPWDMLEYAMRHTSGWGQTEVHGFAATVDGNVPVEDAGMGSRATVYSHCARLTIQKLLVDRADPRLADLIWHPGFGWFEPDGYPYVLVHPTTVFNGAVHEAGDGPGYYSAEINVKGKIIYGFTWNVRKSTPTGEGDYRLTFSFDEECGPTTLNTYFLQNLTAIIVPEEEEGDEFSPESAPGEVGGVAVLDVDRNLTYMDVRILKRGGKKGGGQGGGGGTRH